MTMFAHIAPTVGKLVRLLGSDKDHEALGAARALKRVLTSVKLDLHDLANVVEFAAHREIPQVEATTDNPFSRMRRSDVRAVLRVCHDYRDELSVKERGFIDTLSRWRGQPTERQMAWLSSLYERCKGEHA
jgi:hypothetical protein